MVVENHKLPRVSATLTIDNGPLFEGDIAGVSSLTGQILGSGTTTMSKDDFNEEIDFLGANVSFSSQGASMSSLSKYFPKVLGLMADGALNPTFTQEEFDSQQNQLVEGIKVNEKDVSTVAGQVQGALVYGKNHPKGEFVTTETAANVTLDDVKSFYNKYYNPNNAYLIIIGDVNFNDVKSLVTSNFSKWKKGETINYTIPKVTNVTQPEINFIDMPNAVQSNISITNSVNLKKADPDYYAALLANRILGGGGDARLYNNLRETNGFTYGAYSSIGNDHETATRFNAFAKVRNEVTDSSVVEFLKEIKRIRMDLVSDAELKQAKAAYVGSFVRALEQPSTAARYALNIETEDLPADYYEDYLKNINAVSAEQVKAAANKFFKEDNLRIIIVGKGKDVIPALEKLPYSINYFDKEGNPTEKPDLGSKIADGVTMNSVLQKYIEAIGGIDKIKAVRSIVTSYEGSSPMGTIGMVEKRLNDKFAQVTSVNGNPMMGIIATQTEMFMKQGGNKIPLPPTFLEDTKPTLGTFYELAILNNPSAKLVGIEKVDGKDAYKIELKGNAMSAASFYDVETGLKLKETSEIDMGGQIQTSEVNFSDYKDVNGILFANKKSTELGPQVVEMFLKEAFIDTGVTDADFE
ncbi:peptidase M16 [Urechidicola croceus]|uniref:Peptidase M16 n=1 Tax=Urechidicola croceus TaxID=1850246 RepID=A0A1D8PBZ8_9FLAO|nr:peptidase M16 [Urechidicola croceus]